MEATNLDRVITATEFKKNLGKYLDAAIDHHEVIITKNNQRVARLSPYVKDYFRYAQVKEEAVEYNLGESTISYEEFLEIYEKSELRMEFINGKIVLMGSPSSFHQDAVGNLYVIFKQFLREKGCKVILAPFDVTFHKKDNPTPDMMQPDILIVCDGDSKINEQGRYEGVPSLVVEVLSPSTKSKDMIDKLNTYLLSGVKEYLIVDPIKKKVHQYGFKAEEIDFYELYRDTDQFSSYCFEELTVSLQEIFEA